MKKKPIIRRNEEQWRQIVEAQKMSGQSVLAYCRGKDISDKSFYVWRRKLKGKAGNGREKFLEVVSACESQGQTGALRVQTPGGYHLEVPRGLDVNTLRTVLQALEAA